MNSSIKHSLGALASAKLLSEFAIDSGVSLKTLQRIRNNDGWLENRASGLVVDAINRTLAMKRYAQVAKGSEK